MILSKRPEIDRFLARPDPAIRAVLIHGKDRSGVGERAGILCRAITPDLNDPFNVTLLTDSDIDGDEARLDEALTENPAKSPRLHCSKMVLVSSL